MLDAGRLARNRQWLESERQRLQDTLASLAPAMDASERPGLGSHMADSATEVFEQAKDLAMAQSLRRTLYLVEQALIRMERGAYGVCTSCGQMIDPARLKASPHADLCMACQTRLEQARLR